MMRSLFAVPAVAISILAGSLMFPILAADQPLAKGSWIGVKGEFDTRHFEAQEIERLDDRTAGIKGRLDGFDAEYGLIRFGTLTLNIDDRTRLRGIDNEQLTAVAFATGQRVRASIVIMDDGSLRVRRLRRLDDSSSDRITIEGPVQFVSQQEGQTVLGLLGVDVRAGRRASWDGIARPRSLIDDDDVRPIRGMILGRFGRLSGEVRFDYKHRDNLDLTDQIDDGSDTGRLRARVEWILPATRRMSGMLQLKAESERELEDGADDFSDDSDVTLGRAYITMHGLANGRGSVQLGRSRFDDARDWLFNRDMDAARVFFDFTRVRLEASVFEELIDAVPRHRDIGNLHLAMTVYPGRRHELSAYLLDRNDRFVTASGRVRDFSPRLLGIRAAGEGKHVWSYWLDTALARGSMDSTELDGWALDVGGTLVARLKGEPSLTLGYAIGSGDEDPFDNVDQTFRQSGLQLNNGKWNGVSSFRYYGEALRPELANLSISTIGFGLRPKRKTSIDLIYHRYRLDTPAAELVNATFDDRRLNLIDLDIGEEWDLVVGFEELRHFEFELDLGYFEPGDAFLGPTDSSAVVRLKLKYLF
ncbi:MAG: alginate export family protein [Acidobacteriota bacterium]|nr:alginate export family protein [Acidobacteriota bacterium]MDH3784652.1 alginate export family protein [Acidobacteriota bacterium]